jgi:hypothetical protein
MPKSERESDRLYARGALKVPTKSATALEQALMMALCKLFWLNFYL